MKRQCRDRTRAGADDIVDVAGFSSLYGVQAVVLDGYVIDFSIFPNTANRSKGCSTNSNNLLRIFWH